MPQAVGIMAAKAHLIGALGLRLQRLTILLAKQHLEGLVNSISTTHPTAAVSL